MDMVVPTIIDVRMGQGFELLAVGSEGFTVDHMCEVGVCCYQLLWRNCVREFAHSSGTRKSGLCAQERGKESPFSA